MLQASLLGEIVKPITEFLECLAEWFIGALLALQITIFNLLIAALMAIVSPILELLPKVELEHLGLPPFLAWVNYLFPMEYFVTVVLVVLGIEFIWWAVHIALRWAKAASE
jgi:hypothetical protein